MVTRGPDRFRPPTTRRERLVENAPPLNDGRHAFYGFLLAILVFLLITAISLRQLSDEGHARTVIEDGVATLTEIDLVIAEHAPSLRLAASATNEATFAIPGYPLDVRLGRDEVLGLSDAELRDVILSRSSALVYREGFDAFDREDSQTIGTFSQEGLLRSIAGGISGTTHARATMASLVLGALTAAAALAVLLGNRGFGRVKVLGLAIAAGALPGLAVFLIADRVAGQIWGGEAFGDDLGGVISSAFAVPIRNFLTVSALGAFLALVGIGFGIAGRRLADEVEEGTGYPEIGGPEPVQRGRGRP